MIRNQLKSLLAVSLVCLSLSACGSSLLPYPQPVSVYSTASQEYGYSGFTGLWSPQSHQIAIRSVSPHYDESKSPDVLSSCEDTVTVFEADTGKKVTQWVLPSAVKEAAHLQAYLDKIQLYLQWDPDGQKLYVLQPRVQSNLLQGLILYTLAPGDANIHQRAIYLPESLKGLSTLGFSKPSLSPDAKKLALFRALQVAGQSQYELVQLNLETSQIESYTPIKGEPAQEASWSLDSKSLYVLTQRESEYKLDKPEIRTYEFFQIENQTSTSLLKLSAEAGAFVMSPTRQQVLLNFPMGGSLPPNLELDSDLSDGQSRNLSLVYQIKDTSWAAFHAPLELSNPSFSPYDKGFHFEQFLWDYKQRLNFESEPNPGTINQSSNQLYPESNRSVTLIDPVARSRHTGIEFKQPAQLIENQIKAFMLPGDSERFRAANPRVEAFSPTDSRTLLRLNSLPQSTKSSVNVFYVWNPETQALVALDAKFTDLSGAY